MQEVGWDDGRFVVLVFEPKTGQGRSTEAHIHDMAQCGLKVKSIMPKHGYRDAGETARDLAARWNEENARGLR